MEDKNERNDESEIKSNGADDKKQSRNDAIGLIINYLIMMVPYTLIFFSNKMSEGLQIIGAFFLALLFSFAGIILWAIFKFALKKRFWGLGFIIGGFSTFLIMFLFSNGCGMWG